MRHSLYIKFILGYIVFWLLGFLFISTYSADLTYRHLVKEKSEALYNSANTLAQSYSKYYKGNNTMDLVSMTPQLNAISNFLDSRILIIKRQGTIVIDTDSSVIEENNIESFDPTDFGNSHYITGTYYGIFAEEVLSVIAPITGNFTTYGYVTIHMPMSLVMKSQNEILNILYKTAAIIFLLSLIILLIFTRTVYSPLKKITQAAKKYAEGDLTYNLKLNTEDEMGYLAVTLNYMSNELNEIEEYQKKFISNISHDFRSPLTSIKGYLEAILDGTIPPENQEKYLRIIITETERLNKLTNSMISLNNLGSKSTYLVKTRFDIHRIINDTVASFEGTCSKRKIVFDIIYCENKQMVYADMEKIQQVLYNLVDNAIKFSHDNSEIHMETSVKNDKVFISIKDTGIGIPKDSLKKIWERFYKTDLSRGKDKKGTGLGLAIVKEIIQAHGENIDVISTQGVGTEFRFSLPKASL